MGLALWSRLAWFLRFFFFDIGVDDLSGQV